MPRETITLNSFAGGLSNDSNPADIKDSEVSGLINLIVQPGKVKGLGKFTTENWATAIDVVKVIQPGYGLFTFSADYSSTGGAQNTDYLIVAGKTTDDNNKVIQVFELDKTAMLTTAAARHFQLNVSNDTTDFNSTMFYAGGALRISDSDFTNFGFVSPSRWIGLINRQLFHASKGTTYSGWYMQKQALDYPVSGATDAAQTITLGFASGTAANDGRIVLGLSASTGVSGGGGWDLANKSYNIYATYIYDNLQESFPVAIGTLSAGSSLVANTSVCSIKFTAIVKPGISNKRVTGARFYFSESRTSGESFGDLKFLCGSDFETGKGIYWGVSEDYKTFEDFRSSWTTFGAPTTNTVIATTPTWSTGPEQYIDTYASRTGLLAPETSNVNYKYKAATVAANKAYIANVQFDEIFTARNYPDVVIPSPVGKYDMFAYVNRLEIVPDDGDSIIKLEAIAKKLLVFKKNTMYIIDTSGETEVLDQEQKYRGIAKPSQAVKTENGIAWFNDNGCYYYDGTNTYDLLVDQSDPSRRKIQLEYWRKFFGDDPAIGYDARDKRLFVTDLMSTNSSTVGVTVLAYDFTNFGWTRLQGKLNSGNGLQKYTNIITDWNGQATIIQSDNSASRYKFNWASTATATTSAVYLKSKELFFDEPGIKKNLYAIHVKHKNSGGNVRVRYIKDGTSTIYATSPVFLPDSSSWLHTRLVPGDSTDAKNFKSLTLVVQNTTGTVSSSFEIDDIEIIYRKKGLR